MHELSGLPNHRLMVCLQGILVVTAVVLFSRETHTAACPILLTYWSYQSYHSQNTIDQCVFPVIDKTWKSHQETIWQLQVEPMSILGDGTLDCQGSVQGTAYLHCKWIRLLRRFLSVKLQLVSNGKSGIRNVFPIVWLVKEYNKSTTISNGQASTDYQIHEKENPKIQHQYDVGHFAKAVVTRYVQRESNLCQ